MTVDPATVQEWLNLALAVAAVLTVLIGVYRWFNRKFEQRIIREIREATYQIQPTANGGKSLVDLHKKVDYLADELAVLRRAVITLEDDIEGLM